MKDKIKEKREELNKAVKEVEKIDRELLELRIQNE